MSYGKPIPAGAKFCRLTVIRRQKFLGTYGAANWYRCLCDCGKKTWSRSYELKSGAIKSCGCYAREYQAKRMAKPGYSAMYHQVFKGYRGSAKVRGRVFKITEKQFIKMAKKNCYYCGIPPSCGPSVSALRLRKIKDVSGFRYNGVDRINNSKGYVIGNCVPCCDTCNNSKSTLPLKEWIRWIKRVSTHINGVSLKGKKNAAV